MARMNKIKDMIAMAGLAGGLALAGIPAFAQSTPPSQGGGMMQGIPNGRAGMMMNPEMQQKMSKMMDNCNRMMESMNKAGGVVPAAPANKG